MNLNDLYINLTTWMRNLSIEGNKLCGGSTDFRAAFLDQLIDCRSALCQVLTQETLARRKEVLQTLIESVTTHICTIEKLVDSRSMSPTSNSNTANDDGSGDKRFAAIVATIQPQHGLFSNVAGLDHVKDTLKESLLLPSRYPQLFTGCRAPWHSVLLYGPPGTGKTELAKAVSGESDSVFFSVSSSDLISSYVGESERMVRQLFDTARAQEKQSVIFIDEIDSVCRERSSKEEEHTRRVKNELLKQIEGAGAHNKRVFLLCATNCPWELDTAFLRRFERRLHVPLPDASTRTTLIKMFLKNTETDITDWSEIERVTEGYSGSDLRCSVNDAALTAVRELNNATHWNVVNNRWSPCDPATPGSIRLALDQLKPAQILLRGVSKDDLLSALGRTAPSVTQAEVLKHQQFAKSR